ncbi:MAG: YhcH/YjgK/YiaL family protein [Muribaculaceae bacterium]|nr:YhcH/YjgK/YiaL family protein [Muribaculaceae bacterium]
MILCTISDAAIYRAISPQMAIAIDWLMNHFGDDFVKGTYEIGSVRSGECPITVKCEEPALQPRERASLEAHRRFADIHVPLRGTETIGWAPVSSLKHPRADYDPVNDIRFFGDSATSLLNVKVGQLAVFFPEDAHAPNIGLGNHRKLCIKIPLD